MKTLVLLKPTALAALLCLNIAGINSVSLASTIPIGRYLVVEERPTLSQQQLLQQKIQIRFPSNILTLQEAMNFMLRFSGYHLMDKQHMSCTVKTMLLQQLPEVDRHLGPVTLEQGLQVLAGESFDLLVDPVHRLISFRLKLSYKSLYENKAS